MFTVHFVVYKHRLNPRVILYINFNYLAVKYRSMKIKRRVLSEHILPVINYGSETKAFLTSQLEALAVA